MHAERSSTPADEESQIDAAVLGLLLGRPAIWAVEEIGREIGDDTAVSDSVARLYGTGLVHRMDWFVFPTRAAVEYARLDS